MINEWFIRSSRIGALRDRIDMLERELNEMRGTIAMFAERMNAVERVAADATVAFAAIDDNATRTDDIGRDIVRLQSTSVVLNERIEDHSEQMHRAVAGLFERIEAIGAGRAQGDGSTV